MLTNPYGPYELGYIFATMCVDNKKQKKSKTRKTHNKYRLFSGIRKYEGGIASNRISIAVR